MKLRIEQKQVQIAYFVKASVAVRRVSMGPQGEMILWLDGGQSLLVERNEVLQMWAVLKEALGPAEDADCCLEDYPEDDEPVEDYPENDEPADGYRHGDSLKKE